MGDRAIELKSILSKTPEILLDRNRLYGLLNDLFSSRRDRVNILVILYFELHIHQEINDNLMDDHSILVNRLATKLYEVFRIEKTEGEAGVRFWIRCLDGILIPVPLKDLETPVVSETIQDTPSVYFCCGVGVQDKGFLIRGIETSKEACQHPLSCIFALIFGYLQRSLNMREDKIYKGIENHSGKNFNYRNIYRLQMLLLYLMKNNYFTGDKLTFSAGKQLQEELSLAIQCINQYIRLFCSFTDFKPVKLAVDYSEKANLSITSEINTGIGIQILDCDERINTNRITWFEPNIKYRINEEKRYNLKYILKEVFGFTDFLPGQFEAISEALNRNTNTLFIMPTGAGKSLVYYFCALMQPGPSFVISPTNILIKDQCEILKTKHFIDDIKDLSSVPNIPEDFEPKNRLIFLNPLTFLSSHLIKYLIRSNNQVRIANFILDEIHCISNWSHDFRPDYLMLSNNINRFVDRTKILGFTATANYTVVNDLFFQLKFDRSGGDVIAPLELHRSNQTYSFVDTMTSEDQLEMTRRTIADFLTRNHGGDRQLLVYTKQEETSRQIKEKIESGMRMEVEVYRKNDLNSYKYFALNKYRVLLGDTDVGIGINLPGVTDTIHCGFPLSKSQFVQEIGRAGRDGSIANSVVIFQSRQDLPPEKEILLQRNIPIPDIVERINSSIDQDDIILTLRKTFGEIGNPDHFSTSVVELYKRITQLEDNNQPVLVVLNRDMDFDVALSQEMRKLYILFRIGYLVNWYIYSLNPEQYSVTFLVTRETNLSVSKITNITTDYLMSMGKFNQSVDDIRKCTTIEEIISSYIKWYYNQYLYYHREQFLEMYDFLQFHKNATYDEINKALSNYFSLSIFNKFQDVTYISHMPINDIHRKLLLGLDEVIVADLQRFLENEYSPNIDYLLFLYHALKFNTVDLSRLERVIRNFTDVDYFELLSSIDVLASICDENGRLHLINLLCKRTPLSDVLSAIYNKLNKDRVYYSIMAKICNFQFEVA